MKKILLFSLSVLFFVWMTTAVMAKGKAKGLEKSKPAKEVQNGDDQDEDEDKETD